jgi:pimeloyl-ACP methyl ester carboxylesterase
MSCRALAGVVAASTILAAHPAGGQESLSRFERAACPFERGDRFNGLTFECGWLVLSESRDRPSQRTVRMAVAVLRAQEPNGDPPLVVLHGGPGLGLLGTGMHAAISRWPLARERDIVFYDQRAAGYSQPALCAEHVEQVVAGLVRPERGFDDCAESLRALDVDRVSYSTTSYAADLGDLRRALGYGRWDLYGVSYGARLGLEAMRRDPEGIRSVVLARPLPPGPIVIERALHWQETFVRLFAACEADDVCGAAFAPEEDFLALFEEFEQTPLKSVISDPTRNDSIVLDGRTFVESMQQLLESMNTIGRIPLLLHELRNGDREAAARFILSNRRLEVGGGTSADPDISNFLVNCYDRYAPDLEARATALASGLAPPFRSLDTWERNCIAWQDRFASEDERTPVTSDIPALILTGEFDRKAPPEFGRRIASTLPRAHDIELPATLHISRPGECELEIIFEFLRDPDREPDTSCVAGMPRIRLVTSSSDTLGKGS